MRSNCHHSNAFPVFHLYALPRVPIQLKEALQLFASTVAQGSRTVTPSVILAVEDPVRRVIAVPQRR
jgi:hypothetical protein